MMVLERNRHEKVVCATFRPEAQDSFTRRNPMRMAIPTGTYYSREEMIENHWVWQHRPLITLNELTQVMGERAESEDIETFVQTVSRAVSLSCIHGPDPGKQDAAAKAAVRCSLGHAKLLAAKTKRRKARAGI